MPITLWDDDDVLKECETPSIIPKKKNREAQQYFVKHHYYCILSIRTMHTVYVEHKHMLNYWNQHTMQSTSAARLYLCSSHCKHPKLFMCLSIYACP